MNFFKLQKQLSNPADREQILIRDVYLSDMKGIIDIYQENKNTGALIFGDDFGIPVRIVEVSRRIAAVLSLLTPQSPFQETLGEIKGIIRILKEFEDAGIEQLLVDDISKK